jgi:hypothetical protein
VMWQCLWCAADQLRNRPSGAETLLLSAIILR